MLEVSLKIPLCLSLLAFAEITASQSPTPIVTDSVLRAWMLIGATIGGLFSLVISPALSRSDAVLKWAASTFGAISLTPLILNYFKITSSPDIVLGIAAITSASLWSTVQVIKTFKPEKIRDIILTLLKVK